MKDIYVTKSFLPPYEEYCNAIKNIWDTGFLTNQGPFLEKFETAMKQYLQVENFHFLANGTLALQLALSSLGIKNGEVITTPFSYVATLSSILWQNCTPVFVDIEKNNFTIDAEKIEGAITERTKVILAVHVFGYPCDIQKIQSIADKYRLKVIYDGAHAFGAKYFGKSLLSYGDVSTVSFHATKLFHTIEGGACILHSKEISDKLELQKRFGHNVDEHICLGINAKANEFQAAMGLVNFSYIDTIKKERKRVFDIYTEELRDVLYIPKIQEGLEYNYAYYPVVFKSEKSLLSVFSSLAAKNIYPRRYFYPSLNRLQYIDLKICPVSENIASRIACLPFYPDLKNDEVYMICTVIKGSL